MQETADSGLNATPVVKRATPEELAFGTELFVDRGDERVVTLNIRDTDLADTLYLRVFRDYQAANPTPFFANVEIPATGTVERLRDISLSTWCAGLAADDQSFKSLEAFVADRAFLDCSVTDCTGLPQFRELPVAAESSSVFWFISCNPPE